MDSFISKLNIYELFRVFLPGLYGLYYIYEFLLYYFPGFIIQIEWPIMALLIVVFSLVFGSIIYSFDLCRIFKPNIKTLPTNLMTENYPLLYPKNKERENEHIYYTWYEKSELNSKMKTELQSSLYHLSVNLALVCIIVTPIGLAILARNGGWFFILSNMGLTITSCLSAYFVVKNRLSHQWQRNYWEFEEEVIKPQL